MRKEKIYNHGHVVLEDVLGNDLSIVNNARVSFDQESNIFTNKESGLINFLMRERHGSPFEAVVFRFDIKAPLFVIREWQRHRIGSFNEQSARYSEIPGHYYVPDRDYIRTQKGKPGAYYFERIEDELLAAGVRISILKAQASTFALYEEMLEKGVAKELARTVLPVGMYSRMKWTVNARSIMNFLSLRNSEHAQREIRDYAEVVESMVSEVIPETMHYFQEHGRVCP